MVKSKLAQARMRKNWTLKQAAEAVGVSINTFNLWELGKQRPYGYNRDLLCKVFDDATPEELGFSDECIDLPLSVPCPVIADLLGNDLTIRLLAVAFEPQRFEAVQTKITAILEEYPMNEGNAVTRREALIRLAALPFVASLRSGLPIHRAEDVITQCSAGIAACWELSKSSNDEDLTRAFTATAAYAESLKGIVQNHAQHRKSAASLVAQCGLLRTVLGWHLESLDRAMAYGQDALLYSETADNTPLQLSVRTQLAWIYYYTHQSKKALFEIEQASQLIESTKEPLSPRLCSSTRSILAILQAMHGQSQQAVNSLKQAHLDFFRQTQNDQTSLYADHEHPSLVLEDGMTHAYLGHYEKAQDSFAQIIDMGTLKAKVPVAERVRIEILNNQAIASLKVKKKDLEYSIHLWQAALQGAKALKSEQRFSEALLAYNIMEAVWPDERRVRELQEFAVHW